MPHCTLVTTDGGDDLAALGWAELRWLRDTFGIPVECYARFTEQYAIEVGRAVAHERVVLGALARGARVVVAGSDNEISADEYAALLAAKRRRDEADERQRALLARRAQNAR